MTELMLLIHMFLLMFIVAQIDSIEKLIIRSRK
jgi:hypothetical protein